MYQYFVYLCSMLIGFEAYLKENHYFIFKYSGDVDDFTEGDGEIYNIKYKFNPSKFASTVPAYTRKRLYTNYFKSRYAI